MCLDVAQAKRCKRVCQQSQDIRAEQATVPLPRSLVLCLMIAAHPQAEAGWRAENCGGRCAAASAKVTMLEARIPFLHSG